MKFVVTHYSRQSPDADRWVILPFISRRLGDVDGPFFFGLDTLQEFNSQTILDKENTGSLKGLSRPFSLRSDQALWLTPESDIIIASRNDPANDPQKVLIATDIAPLDTPIGEKTFHRNWVRQKILSREPSPLVVVADDGYLVKATFRKLGKAFLNKLASNTGAKAWSRYPPGRILPSGLVSAVKAGLFDLYFDPFFQTEERAETASIVQFGWLKTFRGLINERAENLPAGLLRDAQQPFGGRLLNFLEHSVNSVEIGTISDTAADTEVSHALGRNLNFAGRIAQQQDAWSLWSWLHTEPHLRIAIVDHPIATLVQDMKPELVAKHVPIPPAHDPNPRISSVGLTFSFRQRIPAGFMYPKSCASWGINIRASFAEAIVALGEDLHWDRTDGGAESIEADLCAIGVEAFPFLELARQLGLLEFYGKKIRDNLGEALRRNEDARAKLLKSKLALFEQELTK